ncbi:MAG TPA: dihydrofolate reductase [Rhodospirillaceae bacterium]|nr:dihydrofolate reductase [Rhodospirillaceae bacterium]
MTLSMIVAVAANGVIGRDNALPWHLPEDLRYFKRITLGKPVLMGRKTFLSIGKPLPGRTNIVLSGDPAWKAEGVLVARTFDQALAQARDHAGGGEIMVIGGARLFEAAQPDAGRIYLTQVHRAYEGDVTFHLSDPAHWQEISRDDREGDPGYSFLVLERLIA